MKVLMLIIGQTQYVKVLILLLLLMLLLLANELIEFFLIHVVHQLIEYLRII